jgi:hypothetical protein
MNLALINPKVWLEIAIAAIIAGACWWGYNTVYDRGADAVQRKWDAVEKERSDQSAKVAADALQATKDLQASADKQRGITNEQIANLNRNLGTAIAGLSNRPSRTDAGGVPGSPAAGTSGSEPRCTGAGLYKEDGEFLIREAARAKGLAIQLAQCQTQYNSAREKLK